MRSFNPSAKLISLVAMTIVLAWWHNPVLNLGAFALCFVLILISRPNFKIFFIALTPILLAALGMFVTGYKYASGGDMPVNDEIMQLASSHLWNGLILASRVLVYAGLGFVFVFTTDRIEMIRSFEKQLHMPQMFAYGILAAWGMFPQMVLEYKRTMVAFKARGLKPFPVSPAVLKPMLVKAVRWSQELSIAMESKGFSGRDKRSDYSPIKMRLRDFIFMAVCLIVFPVCCYLVLHS